MNKPVKPNITIPAGFATNGVKTDFNNSKLTNGFDRINPDVLAGDNLNKFIDDTYQGLNYSIAGTDAINLIQENETLTFKNGNLESMPVVSLDLTGLSSYGNNRLHALKGYSDKGELITDAEGLADVQSYAHSTFDLSKFTVTGTPTVTDDGIASGFSSSNYLGCTTIDVTKPFDIYIKIKTSALSGLQDIIDAYGSNAEGFIVRLSNNKVALVTSNGTVSSSSVVDANTDYTFKISYNGVNKMYIYNGSTKIIDTTITPFTMSQVLYLSVRKFGTTVTNPFLGSIDLKQFSITVDGVEIFSGNKTGVDTYTINSSTVTVPYTLSKTGSKIADSIYRTQVQAVYNEFGYAPYYTLSDTDFTLPQGELYGMLGHKADNTEWVYADDTADADLISSDTSLGTVDLTSALSALLPNDGYTYECLFRYDIHRDGSTTNPGTNIYYTVKTNSLYLMSDEIDSRGETDPNATVGHGGQFTGIIDSARNLTLTISSTTAGVTFKTTHMHLVAYRKLS